MKERLVPTALVVAAVLLLAQSCESNRLRDQLRTTHFRADSLEAVADTQRVTFLGVLQLTERRVVQVAQARDSLDRLLKLRPTVKVAAVVTLPVVDTVVVGVASDTTGREATFSHREPPYTVLAAVTLPVPPETPQMRLAIRLDTIPLGLRLGCRPGKPLATAHAAITSPIWAQVSLVALTQDPALCNAPRASYGFRVPGLGVKLPWWVPILGGAVAWEVVR